MTKYENWRELVLECSESGKPAKTWCLEQQIPYNTYRGWLKRTNELVVKVPAKKFGKVELLDVKMPTQEVKLSCGRWTIAIERGFDAELLVRVLQVVSGICS